MYFFLTEVLPPGGGEEVGEGAPHRRRHLLARLGHRALEQAEGLLLPWTPAARAPSLPSPGHLHRVGPLHPQVLVDPAHHGAAHHAHEGAGGAHSVPHSILLL